jgi:ketosteroid isomerase-like protein
MQVSTALLSTGLLIGLLASGEDDTVAVKAVADRYLQLTLQERDMESAAELLGDDFRFQDPTVEAFGPDPIIAGIEGKETFLSIQKTWTVSESSFDVSRSFTSGSHVLYAGKISWRNGDGPMIEGVPFATFLRVRDGKIVSRLDLGGYDRVVPGADLSIPEETLGIATEYLEAYGRSDFGPVGDMLAEEAVFVEVHADDWGGGQPVEGRAAVLAHLGEAHRGIENLRFDMEPFLASGHHALFVGECSFEATPEGADAKVEVTMPIWVMLEVRDAEVVEHRDFSGFDHYAAAMEAAAAY